jgi:uncharacterized protein YlaI
MGYQCRFCSRNVEVANRLEISGRINGKYVTITVYFCDECKELISYKTINRCRNCGNIFLTNKVIAHEFQSVERCYICNGR